MVTSLWFRALSLIDLREAVSLVPRIPLGNARQGGPGLVAWRSPGGAWCELLLRISDVHGHDNAQRNIESRATEVSLADSLQPWLLGYQLSAISYQLSAISYQLSAIRYQLSAIRYQLSAISHQLSAISFQPSAFSQSLFWLTADR